MVSELSAASVLVIFAGAFGSASVLTELPSVQLVQLSPTQYSISYSVPAYRPSITV